MRVARGFVAGLVALGFCAAAMASPKGVAILVANQGYVHIGPLANPGNDVALVKDALARNSFETIVVQDGKKETIFSALEKAKELKSKSKIEIALFYYAGHGFQIDGENYLAPVDLRAEGVTQVKAASLALSSIIHGLSVFSTRIVVLDACRDNPFATLTVAGRGIAPAKSARPSRSAALRSIGAGLAPVSDTVPGTLIVFSTSPGQVARDGEGAVSPFAAAFAEHMMQPNREVRSLVTHLRRAVIDSTAGQQLPWDHSTLLGNVVLVRPEVLDEFDIATVRPVLAGSFDPARVPFLPARHRPALTQYASARDSKALAVSPSGGYGSAWGMQSRSDAAHRALENCNRIFGNKPCYLYAEGNDVVLSRK